MKYSFFLLFVGIVEVFASATYSQIAKLTIEMQDVTVAQVISQIENESQFYFTYNTREINTNRIVSVNLQENDIHAVLTQLFAGEDVSYIIADKHIVLYKNTDKAVQGITQQSITITGTVVDETGDPLPGVTVIVKGTNTGAATDNTGTYRVTVPNQNAVLVFTYIGFRTQEIAVGSRTSINISLAEDTQQIEEVVVIGYGTVARKDVTTAVATVSTKDLDERPINEAVQAIQGRAAGVQAFMPSGTPGADMIIRVRGTTSYNGSNEPLYVVDGVPVNNLNFLSPNDIASMQILKDASSAAIYGSRAANGVVLITTKTAGNEAKISLNMRYGITKVGNQIKSLNAVQYKELMDELRPGLVPESDVVDRTDWFKELYGLGDSQNYQLQVSDGSRNLRYLVSGGYQRENGIISSTFSNRYNFRINVDNQVRQWLKVGLNVNYSDRNTNGITTGYGSNRNGLVLAAINLPTAIPVKNEEGFYTRSFYGTNTVNPVEAIENNKNNNNRTRRLIGSVNTTVTLMKGLEFKTQFSLDRMDQHSTNFTPPQHASDRTDWGSATDNRRFTSIMTLENVLNYKKNFGGHSFDLMLGTSWTTSDFTRLQATGTHFRNSEIKTLSVANKIDLNGVTSDAYQWGLWSYFGRLSYNYESKYLVTANFRRDGSSRLHPDHRWGTFPSFSAAWRLSAEEFMQDFVWLTDLKLRAGWGQTGNQSGINEYAYLQRYSVTRQAWYNTGLENSVVLISPANLRTADLTWETTTQTNIGMDATMFDSRLTFSVDWYYKYTTDMLMDVSLPGGAAIASSITRNEGEMSNRGIEFTINSRNTTGQFKWSTELVFSHNRNRLEKLALQQVYMDAQTTDAFRETLVVRNQPGQPIGKFWGYISDGVDPQTGNMIYRDVNGDGRVSASDKTYIGDPNPDFTYGLTNTFIYKNLNVTVFIQGSQGNDIFNASTGDIVGMYNTINQSAAVLDRWRKPGDITNIPRVNWNMQPSSYFVEDGSYLRLKDVSVSYNLSGALLKKLGVTRLQPFFTARNLLCLTKYGGMDPEVNEQAGYLSTRVIGIDWGTYPHSKQYVLGINVEF